MHLVPLLVLFTATFSALAAPISEASCAKIYSLCIDAARGVGQRYWRWSPFGLPQLNECVLAATCYPANLDNFLATLEHEAWPLSTQAPLPAQSIPRLSQELYNTLATPGSTATQQSYIDAYYSLLSTVGGPYPANTVVIGYWAKIAAWTGFCAGSRAIPYQNLADWFQWSSVVSAPSSC